ncbi:hypothetical protein BH11PSE2_BH11PSE2_16350 [soil metagenome]
MTSRRIPLTGVFALALILTSCGQAPTQAPTAKTPDDRPASSTAPVHPVNSPASGAPDPAPWVFTADRSAIEDLHGGWPGEAGHEISNIASYVGETAKAAGQMCRSGRAAACPAQDYLARAASDLARHYRACERGEMSDCVSYRLLSNEAGQGMVRFEAESRMGRPAPAP